jgi:hypothetical protein
MNQMLLSNKHSMKTMWGCIALVVLAIVVAMATNSYVLLFIIPCALIMGAMVWMMVSASSRGRRK